MTRIMSYVGACGLFVVEEAGIDHDIASGALHTFTGAWLGK